MTEALTNITLDDCKKSCISIEPFAALQGQVILVTGGTGFMGKWLTEMISYVNDSLKYRIKLYLLGRDVERFKNEVPHLASKCYVNLIEQDVRGIHDFPADVNFIIHAAGSPDNRDHVSQPVKTIETFYKGTQAILDASSRLPGLKKIVHISSHQIYGENESEVLITEGYLGRLDPYSMNNTYAESKRITETLCSTYKSQFKLPLLILRPFAFIGPYQALDKPWAINNFIRDGLLGGPIRILGNPMTTRSYLYGSDMAYWILMALIKGSTGTIYNLGSNRPISLEDLAGKIRGSLHNKVEIISKSSKTSYLKFSKLVPDTSRITQELGVEETYSLEAAISRTIVWNELSKI